jgi:hypothetical protein
MSSSAEVSKQLNRRLPTTLQVVTPRTTYLHIELLDIELLDIELLDKELLDIELLEGVW